MTIEDWTAEEQNDVLEFYGLDNLKPTEWIDRKRESAIGQVQLSSKSAIKGEASTEQILSSLASLDSARQLLRDDFDPLGLKDPAFIRQVQLSRTAPTELSNTGGVESELSTSILEVSPSNNTSIIITQSSFDARAFLTQVHADTSYEDLHRGRQNLMKASQQRNESLKNLVKQNFDRFVNAKNSTELVFRDMQQRRLTDQDHGTRRAIEAVTVAFQRSQEVYGALMARREREQLIRRKLELFNRYSFIFSLGFRLEQAMRVGEYQTAVMDYRRAKTMLQDAAGHTIQKVLQKIWHGHVEKTLATLRNDLYSKMSNPVFSFSVHSKLVDFLIDLDAQPDPVVSFFTLRKDMLLSQYSDAFDRTMEELKRVTPDVDAAAVPRIILNLVQQRQGAKVSMLNVDVVKCWKIRASFLSSLAELFNRFYSDFGLFLTALLSGRFCRIPTQRATEIASYEERVRSFADEYSEALPKMIQQILDDKLMERLDVQDSSAVALHYGIKAVGQFCTMLQNIWEGKAPPTLARAVQLAVENSTKTILNVIWNAANEDCALLPQFETWQSSGEGFDFSTVLIKGFETLLVQLIDGSSSIVSNLTDTVGGTGELVTEPAEGLDDRLADAITSFLDSLLALVTNARRISNADEIVAAVDAQRNNQSLQDLGVSYRLLTVMTNMLYMRQVAAPHLLDTFAASTMGGASDATKQRIVAAIDRVEARMQEHFLAGKSARIVALIRTGTINSGYDWRSTRSPTEIRPYLLTILLELVGIQTQIYDVSSTILRPLMSALVLDALQEFLRCIQMIRSFGPGGYLQARAESALFQQKLITIMDQEALDIYTAINATLDAGCSNTPDPEEARRIIDQLVRQVDDATSMSFACFQYT
jgi:exocyst complex component 2